MRCWRHHRPGVPAGGHLEHGYDYLPTLRDTATRRQQAILLVAEIDGAPVGSVTVTAPAGALSEYARNDEWEIRMLAVDPTAAGRGIGSALLMRAIERSRSAGARRIVLHTADSMTTAHRIYRRFGFTREPDRDDEVLPGLLLRAFALDLPEGRQVTVTELMQHFRQGLVALLPVANDLLIPWRQGEAYDQWDGMAAALFEALVKESAEETLSFLTFPARLRAADYDMDQIAASERWEIEVVDVREPSRILGIFHSLTTLNEPFDAVHVVDSLLLSVRTLSGDRPMAQVNFSFAAVVNGRRVVVDKVTL